MSILAILKGLVRKASPASTIQADINDTDTYHLSEEFCRQVEFFPKENFILVTRTALEIDDQAKRSEDDYGWTECYERSEIAITTLSKDIPVMEMSQFLLQNRFSTFSKVTTNYLFRVIECENVRVFKKRSIVLCFEVVNGKVNNIWHNTPPDKSDNNLYKQFLLNFSAKYPFFLSDENNCTIVDISKPEAIDRYFLIEEEE